MRAGWGVGERVAEPSAPADVRVSSYGTALRVAAASPDSSPPARPEISAVATATIPTHVAAVSMAVRARPRLRGIPAA